MITTVLVANRGEIARRIIWTCRALGLGTVAVFSDADADSPHVAEADAAVRLAGNSPADSYLRADLIIDAAHRTGADAVHPGYGFLAENAAFARDVVAAGLTWVGPPAQAIEAMGSKIVAKRLMAAAGVPVLADLDPATVTAAELPVLIKASSGGGGRGMRIVRDLDELARELELARAEAHSAFGDPTVFCEPYLATGRHIEVQVMADEHATVWALGERECSIQRRHQKVIEEAPSPLVERIDGMRGRLFDAARAATMAVDYTGAGTVEFLADDDGRFFFLEMNTRLQVEHPVTECTTGLDLVALQLHIADGGHLDAEPPAAHGHAIEARLYAEDPAADWQPQTGTLHRIAIPGVAARFSISAAVAGLRLDSGVRDGSVIGVHYDPMLAKLIGWAPSRRQAALSLAGALERASIHGVTTNRDLLVNVLRHKAFLAGETNTAFFDRHGLDTLAKPLLTGEEDVAALVAALALDAAAKVEARVLGGVPSGWRNVVSQPQCIDLAGPGGTHRVCYRLTRDGLVTDQDVTLVNATPDQVVLDVAGVRRHFGVARYRSGPHDGAGRSERRDRADVYVDTARGALRFLVLDRFVDPADEMAPGSLVAPMPGSIVRVAVEVGEKVSAGQPVLWLEAMKMQHQISAPADGVVTELPVSVGQQIDVGEVLAVVSEAKE